MESEMEYEMQDWETDDFIAEALNIKTKLMEKDKKIEELNSKLEGFNAVRERNRIENEKDTVSLFAYKVKLRKALEFLELAKQIQRQFDEFDLLLDPVLDS